MRRATILMLFVTGGCAQLGGVTPGQQADTSACMPTRGQTPMTAPEYLAVGDRARDEALADQNAFLLGGLTMQATFSPWTGPLIQARDCYERALRVYPDSYAATLGEGMVYMLAGLRSPETGDLRRSYLATARRQFGQAFLFRTEQPDPLFYLAVIAILEKQYRTATYLLGYLQRIHHKTGDVLALAGHTAHMSGKMNEARQLFRDVLQAGASPSTLVYADNWLRRHR
jgi:tetratricopeptide (TPR) repeat protein